MKRNLFKLTPLILVLVLSIGCSSKQYQLTILHTNDHHGAVLPKNNKGGLAERATFINSVRDDGGNLLLVDAGDINTGSALSNMFNAEVDIKAYNAMGYEASVFGNHEFDGTHNKLLKQIEDSNFAWLSANMKIGDEYFTKPYIIKEYKGFTVGIFGLTTVESATISSPDKSLTFTNEIEAAKEMVRILKKKERVDIIVALGHTGDQREGINHVTSREILAAVDGIDIYIDGHSHSKFEKPDVINDALLVSAEEQGWVVGKFDLTIARGDIVGYTWESVAITPDKFKPNNEIATIIAPYKAIADERLTEVITTTRYAFPGGSTVSRSNETALGNLACDAQVEFTKSIGVDIDFALTNGGNIRTGLPEGNVTREDILSVLPFENHILILDLKGSDVKDLFTFIGTIPRGSGSFAQVSSAVSYTITYTGDKGAISDVLVNGIPIDENKIYKVAVSDYLASGGDGFVALTNAVGSFNTSTILSDMVIWYTQQLPQPLVPTIENRIKIVTK